MDTNTKAAPVAYAGMLLASGANHRQRRKRNATTTAVKPVRPPSFTPAALSIYDVVLDVPNKAQKTCREKELQRKSLTSQQIG